jgi:hypothetical protein
MCAFVLLLSGISSFAAEVQVRTLAQGSHSGIGQATNHVVRTKAEWEGLCKRHEGNKGSLSPTPVPSVDFQKEMVVAVTMGAKRAGEYAITIRRVETTPERLKIFVVEQSPGPNSIVSQGFSAPFHLWLCREPISNLSL